MEPILTLKNISAYDPDGRTLVPPTDLTVLPGECVCVLAERPRFEALARIIGNLMEPNGGEIEFSGTVGYMSPDSGFWEDMTVLDNTAIPLTIAGGSKRNCLDIALNMLENLGIGYAAHTYPKSLGLCEQRLAALARALVTGPELLILADPISMLNKKETERFVNALSERWGKDRFAVLYCTCNGSQIIPADKTIDL